MAHHGNWKDLFKAVQVNDVELVEFYIGLGVDLNYQHPEFMTSALIESIRCRHIKIMNLLLKSGALPDEIEVESNKKPMLIAKEVGNIEAIKALNSYAKAEEQVDLAEEKIAYNSNELMKAVFCTAYGLPNVLEIQKIMKPSCKDNEILVRIIATAVNSGDVRVRGLAVEGFMKIMMRLTLGFSKPRKPILGTVYSGIVESVGSEVSKFKVGDKVFGMTGFDFGTYAEYIAVKETANVDYMPQNATFEEAVSLIFGGQTAIYFLEKAQIAKKTKQKVLIIGGTGSVGLSAIQIAQHYEADITVVCSSKGQYLVENLRVSKIILYDKEDFTKHSNQFDIIFDAVGKTTQKQCEKLLEKGGIYKTVGGFDYASESQKQLALIKELYEKGKLKAVIDRVFSFYKVVEAHKYVDTGRKKGNVILQVGE